MLGSFLLPLLASTLLATSAARAQDAPQPPPGYGQPPPGYWQPLPWYYPQVHHPDPASSPRVIKWHEGELIPDGYHKGIQVRRDLVASGAVLFGVAWTPTAITGAIIVPTLAIPVAGPFITLANPPFASSGNGSESAVSQLGGPAVFWLVFDGLQQATGIALFIAGLATTRPVLLRDDVQTAKPRWLPVPMSFGSRSAGLGLVGTF